jgi:pSer/pThr/pTyr-binding forkhead associated (FHA) protein
VGTVTVRTLIIRSAVFPDGSLSFTPADLPVSIGRSRRADIVVDDRLMSRVHAEFRWSTSGEFELADRESTNLAIVNQREVDRAVLRSGDRILLGETELFIEISDAVYGSQSLQDRTTREIPVNGHNAAPPDPNSPQ